MNKKTTVGLHLWSVKARNGIFSERLWVTTRSNSVTDAGKKANAYLKANYNHAKVVSLKHRGTIDA